jgi:hypothetical protein
LFPLPDLSVFFCCSICVKITRRQIKSEYRCAIMNIRQKMLNDNVRMSAVGAGILHEAGIFCHSCP